MKVTRLLSVSGWLSFVPAVLACGSVSHDSQSGQSVLAVPGTSCEPIGATADAQDGCNTCTCTEAGWGCTKIGCVACTDGETRKDDCNTCMCSEGQWACTTMYCGDPPDSCPAPREPEGNVACTEAIVYAKSPETGQCCMYSNGCAYPVGWSTFGSQESCAASCEPDSTKVADDGCNTCVCTEEGWACTERACVCQEGTTRRADDGCNVCTCGADGGWACTKKACVGAEPIACGGWSGSTCTDDEYCAYKEGQHCGAADASAVCVKRPEACDLQYQPVCGCDNQTYGNACAAASAGTGVLSSGECGK